MRGGTGVFTGRPAYVWISNQIGNTGVLTGFEQLDNTTARPFNPDPNRYKPTNVTGAPAASYELALTDPDFKFPQVWRSNIAVDQRLPWGIAGTVEFLYNQDVNGIYYINANLPAAQSTVRRRRQPPAVDRAGLRATGTVGGCVNRINSNPGNHVSNAIVLKNQNVGRRGTPSFSATQNIDAAAMLQAALQLRRKQEHRRSGFDRVRLVERQRAPGDPNNPGAGVRRRLAGASLLPDRLLPQGVLRLRRDDDLGVLRERTHRGNTSYVFAGDLNGDGGTANDLIYIPRNVAR